MPSTGSGCVAARSRRLDLTGASADPLRLLEGLAGALSAVRQEVWDLADRSAPLEELRLLDPVPGAAYGEVRSTVIVPDVIVEEVDGPEHPVTLNSALSQYSVSGTPRTSSITKKGRPVSVAPAASTFAMEG